MADRERDEVFLRKAIELAESGPFSSNPRVGAVVVLGEEVIGTGTHRGAGTPHAEVLALNAAGERARGASIYVSLEPCSHFGRTPPCVDAIVSSGISTVVFGQSDPSFQASGGAKNLVAQGITVRGGVLQAAAERVNREWTHRAIRGIPFVTWKVAKSLDSVVAERVGVRTLISGESAGQFVQTLRSRVGAIVVGTRTAVIDNPALTARHPNGDLHGLQPLRVIVGERELPRDLLLFNSPGGEVIHLRTRDPKEVLSYLATREVNHVLLEGGPTLAGAFADRQFIDEVIAIVSPVSFGSGPSALCVERGLFTRAHNVRVLESGPDLILTGELTR